MKLLLLLLLFAVWTANNGCAAEELSIEETKAVDNKKVPRLTIVPELSSPNTKSCWYKNQSFELPSDESLNAPRLTADGQTVVFTSRSYRDTYVYKWNNVTETYQLFQTIPAPFPTGVYLWMYEQDADISADGSTIIISQYSFYVYRWSTVAQNYQFEFTGPTYPGSTELSVRLSANGQVALIGVSNKKNGDGYVFARQQNATWIQQGRALKAPRTDGRETVHLSAKGQDAIVCGESRCIFFSLDIISGSWKPSPVDSLLDIPQADFTPEADYAAIALNFKWNQKVPKVAILKKKNNKWAVVQIIRDAQFIGFVKRNETAETKLLVMNTNGNALVNLQKNAKGLWEQQTSFISATPERPSFTPVLTDMDQGWVRTQFVATTLASVRGNALVQRISSNIDKGYILYHSWMSLWDCEGGLFA